MITQKQLDETGICAVHLVSSQEMLPLYRKHFSVHVEHICSCRQTYKTVILLICPGVCVHDNTASLESRYQFLSWMGTLTIKGPDRAWEDEEPVQIMIIPLNWQFCMIVLYWGHLHTVIIFRRGKAAHLREKQYWYKQPPSQEKLVC